jgi:putative transposase
MARRKESKQDTLIDDLLKDGYDPKDILGQNGLFKQLTKRLIERTLQAELTSHLGYAPYASEGHGADNCRNGKSSKTLQAESGHIRIEVPRDRNCSFEPKLVTKRQRGMQGFDQKVLARYAQGLSARDIQGQIEDLYGVEVFETLISNVTDAGSWSTRGLGNPGRCRTSSRSCTHCALFVKTRQDWPVMTRTCTWCGDQPGRREKTAGGCGWPRTWVPSSGYRCSMN